MTTKEKNLLSFLAEDMLKVIDIVNKNRQNDVFTPTKEVCDRLEMMTSYWEQHLSTARESVYNIKTEE